MNGTQISDTQRNNRTALTGHTIEALIVVVFYACRFIRGERSLGYFLVITALALIPVMLGQFFFFRDRETGMIKHTVGIGFAITYSFMVLTTEEANIYVLVIPMILLVSVFNDVKFSVQINIGTVILSLIMTIGGAFTGKFGYQGSDEAIVQVTAMILVAVYSIYAAQTSNANNQQKMENIKEAQSKTELLCPNIPFRSLDNGYETAKKDLALLENDNKLKRVHGDAISLRCNNDWRTFSCDRIVCCHKGICPLANRDFYKKKPDTRLDTHCIKTGVQLWRRERDSNPCEIALKRFSRHNNHADFKGF